jgi:hypothetical protein
MAAESVAFPAKMTVEPLWKFARYPVAMVIAGVAIFAFVQFLLARARIVLPWASLIGFMIVWLPLVIGFTLALRRTYLILSDDGLTFRNGLQSVNASWGAVSSETVGAKVFVTMDPAQISWSRVARLLGRKDRVGHYSVIPANFVQQCQGRDLSGELGRRISSTALGSGPTG